MGKHKSENYKLIAIKYYESNNVSQKDVSKVFEIDERTFRKWYKIYLENGDLKRNNHLPKSYKMLKKHVIYLLKLLKKNPTWSVQLLWNSMNIHFSDFNITRRHLSTVIRDNNIT